MVQVKQKEFVLKVSDVGAVHIMNVCKDYGRKENYDASFVTPNSDGKEFNTCMAKLKRGERIKIIFGVK